MSITNNILVASTRLPVLPPIASIPTPPKEPLPEKPPEAQVIIKDPFDELKDRRQQISKKVDELLVALNNKSSSGMAFLLEGPYKTNKQTLEWIDKFFVPLEKLRNEQVSESEIDQLKRLVEVIIEISDSAPSKSFLADQPELKLCLHRTLLEMAQRFINHENEQRKIFAHHICTYSFMLFGMINKIDFPELYLLQIERLISEEELEFPNKTNFLIDLLSTLSSCPKYFAAWVIEKSKGIFANYFKCVDSDESREVIKRLLIAFLESAPTPLYKMAFLSNCMGIAEYAEQESSRKRYLAALMDVLSSDKDMGPLAFLAERQPSQVLRLVAVIKGIFFLQMGSNTTSSSNEPAIIKDVGLYIFVEYVNDSENPLEPLKFYLDTLNSDSSLFAFLLEQKAVDKLKDTIKTVLNIVLARSCNIKTLKDAYRILEMSDSLQLLNEDDNLKVFESIRIAVEAVVLSSAKSDIPDPESAFFATRLYDEAPKWGPVSDNLQASMQTFRQRLQEGMNTAPFISRAVQWFADSNSKGLKKYLEVCTEFIKQASNTNQTEALRNAAELIENKLLNIIGPEDGPLIDEMLRLVGLLLKDNDLKKQGATLKDSLNKHIAMLCYWGTKQKKIGYISKAIKLYTESRTNHIKHLLFLVHACYEFPDSQLFKKLQEGLKPGLDHFLTEIMAEIFQHQKQLDRLDGETEQELVPVLKETIEVLLLSSLFDHKLFPVKRLLELHKKFISQPHSIEEFKKVHESYKSFIGHVLQQPLNAEEIKNFLTYVSILAENNTDPKYLVAACELIRYAVIFYYANVREGTEELDFSPVLTQVFLTASLRIPSFIKPLNDGLKLNLAPQKYTIVVKEISSALAKHNETVLALKDSDPKAVSKLTLKTAELLPLYPIFDPIRGREIIKKFFQMPLSISQIISLLSKADSNELYDAKDPQLAAERFQFEQHIFRNFQNNFADPKVRDSEKRKMVDRLGPLIEFANFDDQQSFAFVSQNFFDCHLFFYSQCLMKLSPPMYYDPYMRAIHHYYGKCKNATTAATALFKLIARCIMFPNFLAGCAKAISAAEKQKPKPGALLEAIKKESANKQFIDLLKPELNTGPFFTSMFAEFLPTLNYLNSDEELWACIKNGPQFVQKHLVELLQILLYDQRIVSELKAATPEQIKQDGSLYKLITNLRDFILKILDDRDYSLDFIVSIQEKHFGQSPVGHAIDELIVRPGLPSLPKNPLF